MRRYEVWFLRLGLADGSGAWWFRYLLRNRGRASSGDQAELKPVQVWATWFPRGRTPQFFREGFDEAEVSLSEARSSPFHFAAGENHIDENSCCGHLTCGGKEVRWALRYRSNFGTTMSDKGWIGFSRTPHSNAVFSGEIAFDGKVSHGESLGYGLQGHNCGYRYRRMWTWAHCVFPEAKGGGPTSFEALEYEMPLGMRFQKAVLWTGARQHVFRKWEVAERKRETLRWKFTARNREEKIWLEMHVDGAGASLYRLPYLKTDGRTTFEVSNNSLARAKIMVRYPGEPETELVTDSGAVVEMAGGK